MNSYEKIVKVCMGLKPEESFLVLYDKEKKDIADNIYKEAKKVSDKATILETPVPKVNGEEPPEEIYQEMQNYDVIVIVTSKSLSHTNARKYACENGARIASMPGITREMAERSIDIDYDELKEFNKKIRDILVPSKEIRIITDKGTDITTSLSVVKGKDGGQFHEKGSWGNIPSGEVDSGVKEGATNGKLVIDGSFPGLGILDEPLIFDVKEGYVKEITGKYSEQVKKMLNTVGKEAYKIAELGIGTNKKAIITGKVLEDEKVMGTVHLAVGNDIYYEGKNNVPLHLDGIITKPTIIVDGKEIMKYGEFIF